MIKNLETKIKSKVESFKKERNRKELSKEEEKVLTLFFTKQTYLKDLYVKLLKDVGLKHVRYIDEKRNLETHYLIDTVTHSDKQLMIISKLNKVGTSLTTFELPPELVPFVSLFAKNINTFYSVLSKTTIDFEEEKKTAPLLQKLIDNHLLTFDSIDEKGVMKNPKWAGFGTILSFTAAPNVVVVHTMSVYDNTFLKVNTIYYSLTNDMYYDNESLILPPPVVEEITKKYDAFIMKHKKLKADDNPTLNLKGELSMIQFQLNALEKRKKEIEEQLKKSSFTKN